MAFGQLIGAAGSLSEASLGVWLIFLAFGIKCAFPFLHNWLQDAYPQATVTGAVFLRVHKLVIYALARGFPGTDALIGIGVVMTLFPIFLPSSKTIFARCFLLQPQQPIGLYGGGHWHRQPDGS